MKNNSSVASFGLSKDPDAKTVKVGRNKARLYEPSEPPQIENAGEAPKVGFSVAHVHGFNNNSVGNLAIIDKDTVVFFTGTSLVLQSVSTGRQQFLRGHVLEITCMAAAPEKKLILTGSKGPRSTMKDNMARAILWNVEEKRVVTEISAHRGIVS